MVRKESLCAGTILVVFRCYKEKKPVYLPSLPSLPIAGGFVTIINCRAVIKSIMNVVRTY